MSLEMILQVLVVIGGTLGVIFGVVFVLAMVIQACTEFLFGKIEGILVAIFPGLAVVLEKPKLREGIISIFAVGLGNLAAFLYNLDLIYLISELFSVITQVENPFTVTIFGKILTSVMIGLGASYLHDSWLNPLIERGKLARTGVDK